MCSFSIVSFYYLSSSLSSGLGTHCSFLSRVHPLSMPWERSCDGFWLKVGLCMCSVSIVSFYYLSLSLIRLSSSRQLFSAFDSVSAFSISLPCFQFIALASIILPRSRCRLRFQSFVYHLAFSPRFGRDIPIICHR